MKSKQSTEGKVKNENFEFEFAIIKEPAEIKDLLTTHITIYEDPLFMMSYYSQPHEKVARLKLPELAGLLLKLYGDSDPFFDDYKCSFNYTFKCLFRYLVTDSQEPVELIMLIRDWKGDSETLLLRKKNYPAEMEIKQIDHLIKTDDLSQIVVLVNKYFYEIGKIEQEYPIFERFIEYNDFYYGYDGSSFYASKSSKMTRRSNDNGIVED